MLNLVCLILGRGFELLSVLRAAITSNTIKQQNYFLVASKVLKTVELFLRN